MNDWKAESWQEELRNQLARRAEAESTQGSAYACGLLTIIGGAVALAADSIWWKVIGGATAIAAAVGAVRATLAARQTMRNTATAHRWKVDAGPEVWLMLFQGGPKLGQHQPPADDWGANMAGTALSPPLIGGVHPALALGAVAISAVVNGLSYLVNAPERRRQQAALTARYALHCHERLADILQQYRREQHHELTAITRLAIQALPPRPQPSGINLGK